MQSLKIREDERILIIAPHPDDECIGAGGLLLRHASQCEVIVLTDGRQGQGDVAPEEGKKIRKQEFINEMENLGIEKYQMLDIEDGLLLSHTDCLQHVKLENYDKIFMTGLGDDHPDHKAAYVCVQTVLRELRSESAPRCFTYEVHTPLKRPTHFLDITNLIQEKTNLVRFHKSQLRELPYDALVEQCSAYRATLFRMPGKRIEVYEEVAPGDGRAPAALSETEMQLQKERIHGWILKRWVSRLLEGRTLSNELQLHDMGEAYVYGFGGLGRLLARELQQEGIMVSAVIDRRAGQFSGEDLPVIPLDQATCNLPVIVTAIYEYPEIEKELRNFGFEKIFSLRTLLER